ncbi:Two-component sensor histidine kinase, contains HisKA and HATPase domains [Devosia enhydra]|uniref:histidine kinase n=1 Tax=Devosia enhydra TaxID=665118 RepID=A0A1K2HWE5_9HYPH|nr:PAS domain-containing sensor histidine kinase [Devosia enhydra]SFZ83265.1 Two-component sensor histidine kinase, contains HisKA and HATPase domains [Devosia enhydra]
MRNGAIDLGQAARMRALTTALQVRHVGVQHHRLDVICDFSENLPPHWPATEPLGRTDAELYNADLAERLTALRVDVLSDQLARTTEVHCQNSGRARTFEVAMSPDIDGEGALVGLISTITDITVEREREHAIANLLREVSHRSRNLLAIVQSIAMQTGTHSGSMQDFLDKFRGRLQALAGTQDLVTDTNWRGALLRDLVIGQISRLGSGSNSISLKGDDVMLGPNAALHVGLALHELATNAVLHGALSTDPVGTVAITARLLPRPSAFETLELVWTERNPGPRPSAGHRPRRFGMLILDRIVPDAVGGSAEFSIDKDQVRYRLSIPADQIAS